jgi:hypothetical protein
MRGSGGGGMRVGGAVRGGGGGGARFSARPAISRPSTRPSSGGNVARSTFRDTGNHSATTGNPAGTARFNVKLDHTVKSNAVRETLNSGSVAGALRNRTALRNPGNRARITATAATAGWHQGARRRQWLVAASQWRIRMGRPAVLAVRLQRHVRLCDVGQRLRRLVLGLWL